MRADLFICPNISQICHPDRNRSSLRDDLRSGGTLWFLNLPGCPILVAFCATGWENGRLGNKQPEPATTTAHTPAPPHPPPPQHTSSSPHPETAPPDALYAPAFPNGLACRDSVRLPAAHAH